MNDDQDRASSVASKPDEPMNAAAREDMRRTHTPGPWKVFYDYALTKDGGGEGEPSHEIHTECGIHIARLTIYSREADARLIAAAPDLLAVVHALVVAREHEDGRLICDENSPIMDAARAALVKVSGTPPDNVEAQ